MVPWVQSGRLAWALVGALALVIALLSLIPQPEEILPVSLWDKLGHFLAYGSLALSLGHALALSGWTRGRLTVAGIVLSTAYGGLMESLQFLAPPRSPEFLDVVGNFLGSCAGMGSFRLLALLRVPFLPQGRRGRFPVPDRLDPGAAGEGEPRESPQE
ncbi:MAG TPA: VanZ family protein [Candidatus Methylomirabilis sp.]|nr:VanZ family protein [Candidatus Methylomirabilis sp.]